VLPIEILREAVESYAPYLHASRKMHDPEPAQYGTPYHALCNAVLARGYADERKLAYANRAVRGLEAALDHVIDPNSRLQLPASTARDRRSEPLQPQGLLLAPILKTFIILTDLGVEGEEALGGRISGTANRPREPPHLPGPDPLLQEGRRLPGLHERPSGPLSKGRGTGRGPLGNTPLRAVRPRRQSRAHA